MTIFIKNVFFVFFVQKPIDMGSTKIPQKFQQKKLNPSIHFYGYKRYFVGLNLEIFTSRIY